MKKQEALDVVHEVLAMLNQSVIISGVSLDKRSSRIFKDLNNDGFIIRIQWDLDYYSSNCLNPILEKHKLEMKQENGFVTISKIHP